MRVLVTDGGTRAALAVTRSLGRAGCEVIVGEKGLRTLAQASRYCSEALVYPDPSDASGAFVDYVAQLVIDRSIDAIVPVADVTTLLVASHRDRFEPRCRVPLGPAHVVARAADKVNIVQTAARIGVPVPRGVVVSFGESIPDMDFGYPLVIKPARSRVRTPDGWKSSAVSFASNREKLLRDLAERPPHEFPVLLQERIVGPGIGVFACYRQGRPIALFSHRRLREQPPWGGVSVLCESAPLDPVSRDFAIRLLDEIGWEGVAMVEFKQDLRDGLPKLMEINGRFWGSLQLAVDAGVDFPALLLKASAASVDGSASYRPGVRSRWLWGDIDSLLLVLVGKAKAMGVDRSRLNALKAFLTFWGRDLHYENPRWDDLGPWWQETKQRLYLASSAAVATSAGPAAVRPNEKPRVLATPREVPRTVATMSRSLDTVGMDEQAWNALVSTSETNTVFQTHQWVGSWCETFDKIQEPLLIVASRGQQRLGVVPLAVDRRPDGRRILRFLGQRRADYCDVIAAGTHKEEVVAAMIGALSDYDDWDCLELENVPAESRTVSVLKDACALMGWRVLVSQQCACPTMVIEGREEEARHSRNRASLRRRVNYFQRAGALGFRDLTSHSDVDPYLDRFFEQHIARWGIVGTPSLFLDQRNVAFYRTLAGRMLPSGSLLFSVVDLDGEPIAFHYGFDYNGSILWYKPTFDVRYAQHSPGLVMISHLIGYALDHGRKELDFTVGDEPFKSRFTNHVRYNVRIQVFRDSLDYTLARSRRVLVSNVKKITGH